MVVHKVLLLQYIYRGRAVHTLSLTCVFFSICYTQHVAPGEPMAILSFS